jgi:hypothetical protein
MTKLNVYEKKKNNARLQRFFQRRIFFRGTPLSSIRGYQVIYHILQVEDKDHVYFQSISGDKDDTYYS